VSSEQSDVEVRGRLVDGWMEGKKRKEKKRKEKKRKEKKRKTHEIGKN
jgi:hypothetical protein